MTEQEIIARVREYVTENFLYMRQGYEYSDTDSLPAHGIVDFTGVIELVAFVREQFGIGVDEADITEDNFGTLAAIARLVREKQLAHNGSLNGGGYAGANGRYRERSLAR